MKKKTKTALPPPTKEPVKKMRTYRYNVKLMEKVESIVNEQNANNNMRRKTTITEFIEDAILQKIEKRK